MARLRREFFERYTPSVARELLGCSLVRVVEGRRESGVIVETEAYRGKGDPASHAFRGKTGRNAVMFGEAGHAYVYFTMGMHYCLNVTTEPAGKAGAVLVRAIEPTEGLEEMARRRNSEVHIADGPGRLTKAMDIDGHLNGTDLVTSDALFIESGSAPAKIAASARVGVSRGVDRRWRFFVAGNRFVSRGKPAGLAQNT